MKLKKDCHQKQPLRILELLHNYFNCSEEVDRPRKALNIAFKTGSTDLPYPGTKPTLHSFNNIELCNNSIKKSYRQVLKKKEEKNNGKICV